MTLPPPSSPSGLLPQEPAPVTREQAALTGRFLIPAQDAIFDYLMALRTELDPALEAQSPPIRGKSYPLGRCMEITAAVQRELARRLQKPEARAERAIHAFIKAGGIVRPIWGVLRGVYFQNATQFGSLYIDVSNDTVTVTKPKVEILPMAQCELEAVRDLAHFTATARLYWQAEIFANHVAPSLAPILPMMVQYQDGSSSFQSASDYMIAMMMRDGFAAAEQWLTEAPSPPATMMDAYARGLPEDLRVAAGTDGRQAAIDACRQARALGCHQNQPWRDARVLDYLRFMNRLR